MSNELVIEVNPSEVEIAYLEDKRLVELNRETSDAKFAVGDIYLGKVKKIMPGLNAAFVDVGYEKDAFLHYLDLGPQFQTLNKFLLQSTSKGKKPVSMHKIQSEPDIFKEGKITDVLNSGQLILVQISKEPISTKGPRLTSEISIAGRNLVLMPFSDKVSISQKIKSSDEKSRLRKLIQSIRPKKYGVIVRTAAEGTKVAELDKELRSLVAKWEAIPPKLKQAKVPSLVAGELDRTIAMIRDVYNPDFTNIYVNDKQSASEVKEYVARIAPEKQKIVKHYSGDAPIFEHFGIEKQIKALFGKTVSFKSGAYLIIEHTEAFHVIDVNSGNRSKAGSDQETNALEVNLAAAVEIARQLRLRDMGGIIVVDFIDMHSNENRMKVLEKMREEMSKDRTKHNILPLSKFCLMQITRQRVRPEMHIETTEKCPTCRGTGEVASTSLFVDEIYNNLRYIYQELFRKNVQIHLHPYVAAYLNCGLISRKYKWMWKMKRCFKVVSKNSMGYLDCKFYDNDGEIVL
ncbi:Rne/Rng family ribonuclease [Prolixibacteraceae bacterium]|nr:Rne/Rng family ribonuclease [Prolixibacteraceae bacterium]